MYRAGCKDFSIQQEVDLNIKHLSNDAGFFYIVWKLLQT